MKQCLLITKGRLSREPSGGQLIIHPQKMSNHRNDNMALRRIVNEASLTKINFFIQVILNTCNVPAQSPKKHVVEKAD